MGRWGAGRAVLAGLVVAGFGLAVARTSDAEPYVALFGGTAFSESKTTETRLELNGTTLLDGKFHDVDFDNSFLIGAKVGYFLTRPVLGGHFGAELEFYYTQPHVDPQTVTFTGFAMQPLTSIPQSVNFEVYTLALNLLYRLPLAVSSDFPYGRVQPYLGLGGGAFIATMNTRTSPLDINQEIDDTDVVPGLQAIGGLKLFLLRNLAIFAEYRFAQTSEFEFNFKQGGTRFGFPVTETARDRSDLTQHHAVFGFAFHW